MQTREIQSLFLKHKEPLLSHRYITNKHIEPLLDKLAGDLDVEIIGLSVLNSPIYGVQLGRGKKKVLMWSQMHGNESTTTKALFDLLNTLKSKDLKYILEACTLCVIPILNPDGAEAYTRLNANLVDLNRDAQNLSQPESRVLREVFNEFKPDFCFNLHGQRTIFSAGSVNKSAVVSFLSPAQDETCKITPNRKVAMTLIGVINDNLQAIIPGQVGVYDDAFNLNCVGDTFQSENVPTILFEAGHFNNDYEREYTRELIYISYISVLDYISKVEELGIDDYDAYLTIPENEKCFYDIIIRNSKLIVDSKESLSDIGIQYQEKLIDGCIEFIPKVVEIGKLDKKFGHREIDAKGFEVFNETNKGVEIGSENVLVVINNESISLLSK